MSFITDDNDLDDVTDETPDGDDETPAGLRRAARAGKQAKAEAAALARENALLKAGIDTDTPLGKLFADGYKGELTKDAVKAAWDALNPTPANETTAPPAATDDTPAITDDERDSTAQRQALANGAPADEVGQKKVDFKTSMNTVYDDVISRGGKKEDAFASALSELLSSDDPRTFVKNPNS